MALFGGGLGINFGSNFNSSSSGSNLSTSKPSAFTNLLTSSIKFIPIGSWVLLVVSFLVFIIFSVLVTWVITSWAKGGLIAGFEEANRDNNLNLKSLSSYGTANIKKLLIFKLISIAIFWATLLILILIVGLGFIVSSLFGHSIGIIYIALFGILALLVFLIGLVLFAMTSIYAERLIVLKKYSPWAAWKKGLSISKGNFLSTIIMGVINSLIGCAGGCGILLIEILVFAFPAILIIKPIFDGGFHFPNIIKISEIVILVILFIVINLLVRGIFVVFNYGNWNQLFGKVFEE